MSPEVATRPPPPDVASIRGAALLPAWVDAAPPIVVVAALWALTWLPLLLLSAVEGLAWGDAVDVPFLHDLVAQARVLVGLPVLLLGARFARARLGEAQAMFEASDLIDDARREAFRDVYRRAAAVVHSRAVEATALVVAVTSIIFAPLPGVAGATTWHAFEAAGREVPTLAGWWLTVVVLPLTRYLLLLWVARFVFWSVAMLRVARVGLRLHATHPDRAGGLGFVGRAHQAFAPLVLAVSLVFMASLANDVLHRGSGVEELKRPIAVFAGVALGVWILPMLAFTPALARLKHHALRDYDVFGAHTSRAFERTWVQDPGRDPRALLAGEDVQSLASIQEVSDTVRRIKPVPIDNMDLLVFVTVAVAPALPLVLITVPAADLGRLLRALVV
ncbi:MAG: hypothetical protein KIT58_21885 [Planctomycetota bacterium]|nr:hypothetical protein [Planctomycetota bacterium]